MIVFVAFAVAVMVSSGVSGEYAGSSSQSAGNGVGQGYGYTGQGGVPPQFPQFDFSNFLSAYLENLRKYHEQFAANSISYAYTGSGANGDAKAESSIVFDTAYDKSIHNQNAAAYGFPGGFPAYANAGGGGGGGYGGAFGGAGSGAGSGNFGGFGFPGFGGAQGGFGGVPNGFGGYGGQSNAPGAGNYGGAAAAGSVGPGGGFQSAAVYPENPANPNIFNRFGADGQPINGVNSGGPGYYGVSVSSHSSSSDVDGKKTQVNEAQTTINDNGKVTTFKVKNP